MRKVICTLAATTMVLAGTSAADEWALEVVTTGIWFDMAVAPDGTPHVVSTNCTRGESCVSTPTSRYLVHREKFDGAWMADTIAFDPAGFTPSIAVDGDGGVHIAYMDSLLHLKYVYREPGGSWTTESPTHSNPNFFRNEPDIAVDDTGCVHISYNQAERPWYQWRSDAGWTEEQISSDYADNDIARTSIKVGSDGIVRVAYWSFAWWAVVYERVGGVWTPNVIGGDDKRSPSLALDSNNSAHVLYRGAGPVYVTNKTGAWVERSLEPVGNQGDIVITSDDRPITAYPAAVLKFDTTFYYDVDLYVAVQVDSLWERESIVNYRTEAGRSNMNPLLAVDDDGVLHLAYRHPLTNQIVYGFRDVPVIEDEPPTPGNAAALTVSPNPFNGVTTITYDLPFAGNVRLDVFDVRGRHVRTMVNQRDDAGPHELSWDGSNADGQRVGSGVYFLHMTSPAGTAVHRVVLLK